MEKKNGPVRALQLLFMALLYGQLLFAVLTLVLIKSGLIKATTDAATERKFELACLVISIIAVPSAFALFKRKMEQVRVIANLSDRFVEYRGACIMKYFLIEIPTLLSIVFYLLTGNWAFIIIAVLLMFIFMSQNPIRQRIKTDLQVDDIAIDEMNNLKG
jgi:hypothetical protein